MPTHPRSGRFLLAVVLVVLCGTAVGGLWFGFLPSPITLIDSIRGASDLSASASANTASAANPKIPCSQPPASSTSLGARWNSATAQAIASAKLANVPWPSVKDFCVNACLPVHWYLGERSVSIDGVDAVAVVFASIDDAARCHACAPHISVFEFRKLNGKWALARSDVAFTKWGESGDLLPEQVEIQQLDQKSYAVFLSMSYIGQGYETSSLAVYARLGEKIEPVLQATIGENNEGAVGAEDNSRYVNWKATVSVVPVSEKKPEIVLTRRGISEGKDIDDIQRFRFMGEKYLLVTDPSAQASS